MQKYDNMKRTMDVVIALSMIIILLPLFFIISVTLKVEEPEESVFFSQKRVGRYGKEFNILKFRSMRSDAPDKIPARDFNQSEEFQTYFGKILRRFGVDELPQLLNVLKGEMSIVGPRPLIAEEGSIHQKRMDAGVYELRPGLTGLAQVNGGNTISDEEKLKWDKTYLKNRSFREDFVILIKTAFVCILGKVNSKKIPECQTDDYTTFFSGDSCDEKDTDYCQPE